MGSMAGINPSPACSTGSPSRTIAVSSKGRALKRPLPTQSQKEGRQSRPLPTQWQKEDNYGHHTSFNRGPVPD